MVICLKDSKSLFMNDLMAFYKKIFRERQAQNILNDFYGEIDHLK